MTVSELHTLFTADNAEHRQIEALCHRLFGSFHRRDQRRWGEVYVRGLVTLPGRKTIRRIANQVLGRNADQALQQFVNQSPWRWQPVRHALAREVSDVLRPRALVVEDVVFPKNGTQSVGVAKQFVPSLRRTVNCQLAVTAMLAGDHGAVPVNWRLRLPREWAADQARRERSRVPDNALPRPRLAHVLDMLDEMSTWDTAMPPVVLDARQDQDIEHLLRGLEDRDLQYVVQVDHDTNLATAVPTVHSNPHHTAGALVSRGRRLGRMTMNWPDSAAGWTTVSRFVLPEPVIPSPRRLEPVRAIRRPRHALAERGPGVNQTNSIYLTNITHARLPDLVTLLNHRRRAVHDLDRLPEESGLRSFEGRSYVGWHHHVTLVSVAHGHRVLRRAGAAQAAETPLWCAAPPS